MTITVKDIIFEDFINYKKPSMFIGTNSCTFKCEKEDCSVCCQNSKIALEESKIIPISKLIKSYVDNIITESVVFGGLEPFDQIQELIDFIIEFRKISNDDIVIYTGYTEDEISSFRYDNKTYLENILIANKSKSNDNILIIKYGRFKANQTKHFDSILGVELASNNQYAKLYKS